MSCAYLEQLVNLVTVTFLIKESTEIVQSMAISCLALQEVNSLKIKGGMVRHSVTCKGQMERNNSPTYWCREGHYELDLNP